MRAVVAPSMGDIFMSNAAKNGLLTIVLPAESVAHMIAATLAEPGLQIGVDLDKQSVACADTHFAFEIDAYRKRCLLSGLDELGYTLTQMDRIEAFELGLSLTDTQEPHPR